MKPRKYLAGAGLACLLVVFAGCSPSPKEQGFKFKKTIDAAVQSRDFARVADELQRLDKYIQNLPVKDLDDFSSAWPNDSFDSWLDNIEKVLKEQQKEKSKNAGQ